MITESIKFTWFSIAVDVLLAIIYVIVVFSMEPEDDDVDDSDRSKMFRAVFSVIGYGIAIAI